MAFNQLFRSEIVAGFHQNRRDDLNSDTDFKSKFDIYRFILKFSQFRCFHHFSCCFQYKSTFNRVLWCFNWLYIDLLIKMDEYWNSVKTGDRHIVKLSSSARKIPLKVDLTSRIFHSELKCSAIIEWYLLFCMKNFKS